MRTSHCAGVTPKTGNSLTPHFNSPSPSQAKPSQAKPSQAKPSQAKPSQAKPYPLFDKNAKRAILSIFILYYQYF